jgi:hypothetical protein
MGNNKALESLNKIKPALDDYQGGYANSEAIRAIDSILKEVEDSAEAPINIVTEKTGSIRELVKILYSPRRHQSSGGIEHVKSLILQDIKSLKLILSRKSNTAT